MTFNLEFTRFPPPPQPPPTTEDKMGTTSSPPPTAQRVLGVADQLLKTFTPNFPVLYVCVKHNFCVFF